MPRKSTKKEKAVVVPKEEAPQQPKREHIFPETILRGLAEEWQARTKVNPNDPRAAILLEEIIIKSTPMFSRLAQFERFTQTVQLDVLIAAAQIKVERWLTLWDKSLGTLFKWFSRCAKNAFRGEVAATVGFSHRVYTTNDDVALERLAGHTDHEVDRHDLAATIHEKLHDIVVPWKASNMREAVRFYLECITTVSEHSKSLAIRSAMFGFGLSAEMAKFLYAWTLVEMRQSLYENSHISFSDQDIIRASHSLTHLPQMMDIIGVEKMKRLIVVMGGQRIRIPTTTDIDNARKSYDFLQAVRRSDGTEDLAKIARKHGKPARSAEEHFHQAVATFSQIGEHNVYDDPHS